MNHLAHLYLSGSSEKIMVGNFIADGVKGKKYSNYEPEIVKGILMHRAIDTFTDSHEIVRHSKGFFREKYGLYSGVLIDLFYDHYLAKNWTSYSTTPLADFAANAYRIFSEYLSIMPGEYQHMFPYMQKENWLLNYAKIEGIRRSLLGMSHRIMNNPGIEFSYRELEENDEAIESDFRKFFPALRKEISSHFTV